MDNKVTTKSKMWKNIVIELRVGLDRQVAAKPRDGTDGRRDGGRRATRLPFNRNPPGLELSEFPFSQNPGGLDLSGFHLTKILEE